MQIQALKRVFVGLNPRESSELVDFSAHVDSALTLSENRGILEEAYPQYQWYKRQTLGESLQRAIEREQAIEKQYQAYESSLAVI